MVFEPGQASVLFDYWSDDIEMFVVGGVADANEAQTIRERYPNVKCLGFEPNKNFPISDFPGEVRREALWSENRNLWFVIPDGVDRSAGAVMVSAGGERYEVQGRRLDEIVSDKKIALWIDIEYAELYCLRGCERLLEKGEVLLVNLETFDQLLPPIAEYLGRYGLREVKRWNDRQIWGRFDIIFKKEF